MVIRSKNRLYIFDRHISDAVLRLSVVALSLFFAFSAWLFVLNTDRTIDAIFWIPLQNLMADLAGKEATKLGTSEKSIYTLAFEQIDKDGALITQFPEYAARISPNNQALEMINLRIRDLRIIVVTLGLLFLAVSLFFLLIARLIYGNGVSRFRIVRWLFLLFNDDTKERHAHGFAHFFSAVQKKVFEVSFAMSKGNADGSFEFDLMKFYKQIWPGDETVSEVKKGYLGTAFSELCEDYFYFPVPFGRSFILKAFCPVIPFEDQVEKTCVRDLTGREVEVFNRGRFKLSPPLYTEFLKFRYLKIPHPIAYAMDDKKNPYAFRIYLFLWEKFVDQPKETDGRRNFGNTISMPLYELLENVCFEMAYGHESNLLEQFHQDIAAIKDLGLLRSWFIEEHGDKIGSFWYKDVDLFNFDSNKNSYHLNTNLLIHKIYSFELTPTEALDKIKVVRRRCAYLDEFDTPCTRPALPGSPYCRRHSKALEYDGTRIFHGKVKALEAPPEIPRNSEEPPKAPSKAQKPPPVIIVPPKETDQNPEEEIVPAKDDPAPPPGDEPKRVDPKTG